MEKQSSMAIGITIDDNEDSQVIRVKDSLNQLLDSSPAIINLESGQSSKPSIYKIPHFMKEINPKPFEPQVVSFGPYHHGKPHLLPMEREKLEVFRHFKTNYGLDVESIVKCVSSILEHLKGSYDKLEKEWTQDPDKFLQLMIVDGCFLLQLFIDFPTSLISMRMNIAVDMMRLESQLPMKLLDQLYFIAIQNKPKSKDLKSLICDFMSISLNGLSKEYLHILDMYRASLLHPPIERKNQSVEMEYDLSDVKSKIIRPATQLREAGIKFKISKTNSLTDVSFDPKRGVLRLLQLVVEDNTESLFLNVMAFERLHVDAESSVTSFVMLMDNLIDEDRDVALLTSNNILANLLGNYHDAAKLFGQLGNGWPLGWDSHIDGVRMMVNKHYNKPYNKFCAGVRQEYFQNPWTFISVIAAIMGFVLLILQVLYQLFDFYLKV